MFLDQNWKWHEIISTQECFQGLREAHGGVESHHSSWRCKESHSCCCHGPLAPLAMGDSGTSTILTWYEFMQLWSLCQSERSTTRDPIQPNTYTYPCYRAINTEHKKMDALMVYDALQTFGKRWWISGVTILKVHKFFTSVNKAISEISNCSHYFISSPCMLFSYMFRSE